MRLRVARIARCLLLAAFSLIGAAAVSQASGLNLAWTQCAVDGGASNRNFACNSNADNCWIRMNVTYAAALLEDGSSWSVAGAGSPPALFNPGKY